MAANAPYLLQLPVRSPEFRVLITGGYAIVRSRMEFPFSCKNYATSLRARKVRVVECVAKSTELEALVKDGGDDDNDDGDGVRGDDDKVVTHGDSVSSQRSASASSGDSLSLGIREPVYEIAHQKDPDIVFSFLGGKAFIDSLLPRLNPTTTNGGPSMPFVLEVVEAALHSRIQRLEHRLWDLEPRVQALLEVLPNRLTADILEELRISKQKLVELGSRAGALKQMLLDILEDTHEIRHICIIGRNCVLKKENDEIECSVPLDKEIAEEEEEEIEMLLENYLQRLSIDAISTLCESCHGQAERLLDSAKEMEDSIAVNLSSRRLEVSRFELILQVGTFCVAAGALVAGIFGMNLRSYLEEHVFAFWLTTAGIIVGAVLAFYLMYWYLRTRKIL
uniref:Magnesium transporter n=1 Tax=Solanum tuberosum TaxID=4113 RepID=M0ZI43_SOLTU